MKKMMGKLAVVLALVVCVLCVAVMTNRAKAEIASGTWGDLSWVIDNKGCLTISGSGYMGVFSSSYDPYAWHYNSNKIRSVVIQDGVKGIASYAFSDCRDLISITIPSSVTSIGNNAFNNCSSLTSILIPESVTSIGFNAFNDCSNLTNITILNSKTYIGKDAFKGCSRLTNITISSVEWWLGIDCMNTGLQLNRSGS